MIYQTIQQDIDLWEAWIEFDHTAENYFGTLYIMGEVVADKKEMHPFIIKCVHENEPRTLVLEIPSLTHVDTGNMAEVVYSENLGRIDQYESVKIYCNNELITEIGEIEILI